MKKLPTIPDDILQKHEKAYFDSIKSVLDLVIAGKRPVFPKRKKGYFATRHKLSSKDVSDMQTIRNLFVNNRLLTATATEIRTLVDKGVPTSSKLSANVVNLLLELFNYSEFQKGRILVSRNRRFYWENPSRQEDYWGGYEFLQYHSRTLTYCPYCNADTVYAFEKGNHRKVVSALDHFYPQKKYPFLALSLYNLVPVCSRCNSQMKGDADMTQVANPYIEDMHQEVFFFPILSEASPSLNGQCHIAVLPREKVYDPRAKEFVRLFELENLYSSAFAGDALLCMERVRRFSPEYRRYMGSFTGVKDPRLVDVLLFGIPYDESQINKTRLGKMTLDIVERFGVFCQATTRPDSSSQAIRFG